jgi:hypothetical protein
MMKRIAFILALVVLLLLLATPAMAMNSTNYRVDWNVPLTGSGGPSSSSHYAVHLTIGQSANGAQQSTHYQAGLGFWYGSLIDFRTALPLVRK